MKTTNLLSKIAFGVTISAILGSSASAGEWLLSSEGHEFYSQMNKSGFTLKSRGIISRYIDNGPNYRGLFKQKEIMHLGKGCDAISNVFGRGRWGWANGGVSVTFRNGKQISFPRQSIGGTDEENKKYGWSIYGRCEL